MSNRTSTLVSIPTWCRPGLASDWCRRTAVRGWWRSTATAATAIVAAKDEHRKMFDVSLPLSGQLEKLDSRPLDSVNSHCVTRAHTAGVTFIHFHHYRRGLLIMSLPQPSPRTTFEKRTFRCTAPAIWNSLPKTVIDSDSIAIFKSRLRHSFSSRLTLFPFLTLTSTLPGYSASEVTTIRRYTNMCIIIIFLTLVLHSQGVRH